MRGSTSPSDDPVSMTGNSNRMALVSFPLQQELVLKATSTNVHNRVTEGIRIVRRSSSGGKTVIIEWPF